MTCCRNRTIKPVTVGEIVRVWLSNVAEGAQRAYDVAYGMHRIEITPYTIANLRAAKAALGTIHQLQATVPKRFDTLEISPANLTERLADAIEGWAAWQSMMSERKGITKPFAVVSEASELAKGGRSCS